MSFMNKALLLAAVLLAAPLALRADEDEEPASGSTGPEAAEAARDKGYRADEPAPAGITGGAPAAPQAAPRAISVPAQRPLGVGGGSGSGAKAAGPGGGGVSAGRGISCEKSVPALTGGVVRKEIDFKKTMEGPVTPWEVPPNGAISYKFTAPASGGGTVFSTMGTNARPVATAINVSATPCDFDIEKTREGMKKGGCHMWGPVENGLTFAVGADAAKNKVLCTLKPGGIYYLNIRSLSHPDKGAVRDACADEIPFFKSQPKLRAACGGIWKMYGAYRKDSAPASR